MSTGGRRLSRLRPIAALQEVDGIEASMASPGYVPNSAQRRLAEEVTRFVHGEEGLRQALAATQVRRAGFDPTHPPHCIHPIPCHMTVRYCLDCRVTGSAVTKVLLGWREHTLASPLQDPRRTLPASRKDEANS